MPITDKDRGNCRLRLLVVTLEMLPGNGSNVVDSHLVFLQKKLADLDFFSAFLWQNCHWHIPTRDFLHKSIFKRGTNASHEEQNFRRKSAIDITVSQFCSESGTFIIHYIQMISYKRLQSIWRQINSYLTYLG